MLISKDAPLGLQLNAPCLQRLLEVLSRIHSNGAEPQLSCYPLSATV